MEALWWCIGVAGFWLCVELFIVCRKRVDESVNFRHTPGYVTDEDSEDL